MTKEEFEKQFQEETWAKEVYIMSFVALIAAILGYVLFFLTDWVAFPLILIIVSFVVALIDLVTLYNKEKLIFSDFVQEAFREKFGSALSLIAGIGFIILLIIV